MGEINSYRDLKVWQLAMDLAVEVYSTTKAFPASENYGLTQQLRRAATSVAANVAEGHGRETTAAFINFLRIAQGSLKEVETLLLLATRVGVLAQEKAVAATHQCDELGRMLRGLIRSLQAKASEE